MYNATFDFITVTSLCQTFPNKILEKVYGVQTTEIRESVIEAM